MWADIGQGDRFGKHTSLAAHVGLRRYSARRLLMLGAATFLLAACGGDGDSVGGGADIPTGGGADGSLPSTDGSDGAPTNPALDCLREGYPCSFDAMPLALVERSLSLSDDVAKQLGDGVAIEQVASFLNSQSDMAEVTVDGAVLAFRLVGGRPMIVDVTGEQEMLTAASAPNASTSNAAKTGRVLSTSQAPSAGSQKLRTVHSVRSDKITDGNKAQRHALVLSPFRYETNFGDAGEQIAAAINTVRGYAGHVTYLATTSESDPQVTVDVLTQLDKYDVIHIDTHGGTLCKDKDAAVAGSAKTDGKKNCVNGLTDFLVQRFHGTAQDLQSLKHPGVVHYRGRLHQSIAVTADFFRHYYPQGLADKLFILGSCNTYRTDMATAIAGSEGVYVSWDGFTDYSLVKNSGLSLIDSLGLGLTVGESFARMPTFSPENPEATGALQRTPRAAGGDLRIRDLISVRDNITGEALSDSSGIEVMEAPDDGKNDNLNLEFAVDGITPEQLENFYLNLVIDDHVIGHINLKQHGVPASEFSYTVSSVIPLPFDVQELQALHMDFWIPLPDLGEDHFIAAPRVNDREQSEVGKEWVLGSTLTESHHDSSTIKTAKVVFEIEPNDDPAGRYHSFRVKSGTLRIQRDYEDALNCRFNIDHTIQIPPGAGNNYVTFDTGGTNLMVEGFGSAPSEDIKVTSSCGDTVTVRLGGVYWLMDETAVSSDSAQGVYNDGAVNPTIIQWTLDKTL